MLTWTHYARACSQLEAMVYAAFRAGELGWRANALHMMVLSTDASYHEALDGVVGKSIRPFNFANIELSGVVEDIFTVRLRRVACVEVCV